NTGFDGQPANPAWRGVLPGTLGDQVTRLALTPATIQRIRAGVEAVQWLHLKTDHAHLLGHHHALRLVQNGIESLNSSSAAGPVIGAGRCRFGAPPRAPPEPPPFWGFQSSICA